MKLAKSLESVLEKRFWGEENCILVRTEDWEGQKKMRLRM